MRAQALDFVFSIFKYPALLLRQLTLTLLKSDTWLNFNKSLFKVMSFECHARFLHSSRKRAEIPRVLGLGEYFCLRCGEKCWSVMFHTLPFVSIVVSSSVVLFLEVVCGKQKDTWHFCEN
jgi:hypothetical protein